MTGELAREAAVGSRLAGASLAQRCQYYHLRDNRTHCPPEKRGDRCEGTGPFFSSPGSKRFLPQAIFLICPRSQEGGSGFLVLTI